MLKKTKTRYCDEFFYHKNDSMIGHSLGLYGEYSQLEIDFILGILNKSCVVYDIGANIGYHTTAFASVANLVYAFEPNIQNFTLLTKNTKNYKNVCLVNAAVSTDNGVLTMEDYDPNTTGNYGNLKVGVGDKQVLSINLDSFNIMKPDFIKIDVEGAEYFVIQSLENKIKNFRPVVYYEAHETPHFKEIFDFFNKINYNLYWCQVNNFNPKNYKNNKKDVFNNTALFSILALPFKPTQIDLDEILTREDTWEKLIERKKNNV